MVKREKIARFTCPGCAKVTLAPLGVLYVGCDYCGDLIGDTAWALDCLRTLFREREEKRLGHAPFSSLRNQQSLLVGLALSTENNLGISGF